MSVEVWGSPRMRVPSPRVASVFPTLVVVEVLSARCSELSFVLDGFSVFLASGFGSLVAGVSPTLAAILNPLCVL